MGLPRRLRIFSSAYALDGGTTSLSARDEAGGEHRVVLVQHAFPQGGRSLDAIPGRLYFDGQLVPMRSKLEAEVLNLLRVAEIRYEGPSREWGEPIRLSPNALILGDDIRQVLNRSPEENLRAQTAQVIEFVESEQYLRFAMGVEQAADQTRYTVWVASHRESRKHVLVRLSQVLGLGLPAAREMLDQDRPLAEGISAIEVADLAQRYRAAGLGVRVEPVFRWPLP